MRFILGCAILTALVTGGALLWTNYGVPLEAAPTATTHDGIQHARITALDSKAHTLTIESVTYFDGADAVRAAKREVHCDRDISECVPTLKNGYYLREGGSPRVTFPLIEKARLILLKDRTVSLPALAAYVDASKLDSIYRVSITAGRVTEVKEVAHY